MKTLPIEKQVTVLNRIKTLNSCEAEHVNRPIEVFNMATGKMLTYMCDSILKALVISSLQADNILLKPETQAVFSMSEDELLKKYSFTFGRLSIGLGDLAVWKYI